MEPFHPRFIFQDNQPKGKHHSKEKEKGEQRDLMCKGIFCQKCGAVSSGFKRKAAVFTARRRGGVREVPHFTFPQSSGMADGQNNTVSPKRTSWSNIHAQSPQCLAASEGCRQGVGQALPSPSSCSPTTIPQPHSPTHSCSPSLPPASPELRTRPPAVIDRETAAAE